MPQETDRKMMEILRILADREEVLGAKTIAEELKKKVMTSERGLLDTICVFLMKKDLQNV